MIYFYARHIESCDFSRVGRITHAVFCLHHFLLYVGNIGTIGTNGIANGTIGKTLNGICLPMVHMYHFYHFAHCVAYYTNMHIPAKTEVLNIPLLFLCFYFYPV